MGGRDHLPAPRCVAPAADRRRFTGVDGATELNDGEAFLTLGTLRPSPLSISVTALQGRLLWIRIRNWQRQVCVAQEFFFPIPVYTVSQ